MGPGFCPQLGGVGPCPAQCIWQGSGFAADQTNAMLATSNGGDKISRNRNSLRLSGITVYAEEFSICGREMNCFFIRLSRDYFPYTQRFFGVPVWGWYHYPRRALHAAETLDAQGTRWLNKLLVVYSFPVGSASAHSGSQGQTRGVFTA